MGNKWIALIVISLIMIGCGPKTRIQETYSHVDRKYTGEVTVFYSFNELERSYKKVAVLEVISHRPQDNVDRNKMISSIKSKARKIGAEGVVVVDEGRHVSRVRIESNWTNYYTVFIQGIAIVYE